MARDFHDREMGALRSRAEARLSNKTLTDPLGEQDLQRYVYELQVHQVELQMQNEELRRLHTELEMARLRYFDLFENAPIAYLTLNEGRVIEDANLAASQLLGESQLGLAKQSMLNMVHIVDRDRFLHNLKQVFITGDPCACDVHLLNKKGTLFSARLEMSALLNDFNERLLRVMIVGQQ